MLERGKGSIVNISPGAGIRPMPLLAPGGAAKPGVKNLTATLAVAWTAAGVRVNALALGASRMEFILSDAVRLGIDESVLASQNAMGRIATPEEVEYSVVYLAAYASRWIQIVGKRVPLSPREGTAGDAAAQEPSVPAPGSG